MEIQEALDVICNHLNKLADQSPPLPDVNFIVSWIDIGTYDKPKYQSSIEITASVTHKIDIPEL